MSNTKTSDPVSRKIQFIIRHYKEHFDEVDVQEHYKWKAIDWYRQHWNDSVSPSEFAAMVETSLGEADNLLSARMYYAYAMAVEFAQAAPERVQELFRILYDESRPLAERYESFRKGFDGYVKPLGKNHYQDLHAVSVYLTFEYPERYFIYKYSVYRTFSERVGYREEKPKHSSSVWKLEANNRLCQRILEEVKKDDDLIRCNQKRAAEFHTYGDQDLHMLAVDIAFYGAIYMQESDFASLAASEETESTVSLPDNAEPVVDFGTDIPLNTILYGPPGTGKTYYTVIYAVATIEDQELEKVQAEPYSEVRKRYDAYKENGQIAFTTFHQAYGYEEFIEGIKPVIFTEDGSEDSAETIRYKVEPGVFKKFCERASQSATASAVHAKNFGINDYPNIWKVSLEGTGDNPTRTECLQNGHIRIGWDGYGKEITDQTDFSQWGGKSPLNAFINRMQIGDVVLSCYSASTIDAIGVVTGDYEWHDEYKQFKRMRRVNWIVKNIQENILDANGGISMTLSTVYRMANISMSDIYRIIEKYMPVQSQQVGTATSPGETRYVFIIDEINRGNISKIFGELITLIEPSKREGQPEGIRVLLPYSQKTFSVPKNVYLIGTMNTADRSITAIDTALRRRFCFREMLPDPELLADISVEGMSIREMLSTMNQRIAALYDREHTIGHAYFMPLKEDSSMDMLGHIFEDHILPLLQEYFFEDYGKIRLVLGDNRKSDPAKQFVQAVQIDYASLFGNTEFGTERDFVYRINPAAFYDPEAYLSICLPQGQDEDAP